MQGPVIEIWASLGKELSQEPCVPTRGLVFIEDQLCQVPLYLLISFTHEGKPLRQRCYCDHFTP